MKTIKIKKDSLVKLYVKISSDAIVGSNVSLDDVVIKKSIQYSFNIGLENVNDKILSVVSNFFVSTGNIDAIMNNTNVTYTIKSDDIPKEFNGEKIKINDNLFMVYFVIKLIKN